MTVTQIEQKLRAKLEADQAQEILGNTIHNVIGEVLKNFVGKKLTKRFADKVTAAVQPLFPEPSNVVCHYPHPGKLTLWVHGLIPYDQRWGFYIAGEAGYQNPTHSIAHPTLEGFEYEDQAHGRAAEERIAERQFILDDRSPNNPLSHLAKAVYNLRAANEQFERIIEPYHYSVRYEAEKIVDEKE